MTLHHLVSLADVTTNQLNEILELSANVYRHPERYHQSLSHRSLAMIFQKPSTRTRVSFETGMWQLGGHALYLGSSDLQLGRGETLEDTARVLSRYVDCIMARVYAHQDVATLAEYASVPVINGLSDLLHPCQAICDYFTIQQRFGELKGINVTYVGDGNNMAHSLALGAAKLGVNLTIVTPPTDYLPDETIIAMATDTAKDSGASIKVTSDLDAGVRGAHVVYTDVWASMGQEEEHKKRLRDFQGYQIDATVFGKASKDAVFMHCLPAHRGEEVTADVADHSRSIIFDQAENRLHTQKAVLLKLVADR